MKVIARAPLYILEKNDSLPKRQKAYIPKWHSVGSAVNYIKKAGTVEEKNILDKLFRLRASHEITNGEFGVRVRALRVKLQEPK